MKTIHSAYSFLGATALICLLLILFEPPHSSSAKAADKPIESVSKFKELASTTTTTTSPPTTTTSPPKVSTVTTTTFTYDASNDRIVQLVTAFFPENPNLWLQIAKCESGLNPNAYNPEGASGLFQVMMPLHADMVLEGENIFDPVVNVRIARSLSRNGTDTTAWNASKGCWS